MKKISVVLLLALFPILALAHGDEEHEFVIRMTDNGFEPQELTVTEGDEVTFVNNDDVDRWPASNLHPTHGLYPAFDPLKGIPPGNSWTMKFDQAGAWRMHDHLIPRMTGAITVLENTELAESAEETPTGFWAKLKAFFTRLFGN